MTPDKLANLLASVFLKTGMWPPFPVALFFGASFGWLIHKTLLSAVVGGALGLALAAVAFLFCLGAAFSGLS